MNYTLHGYSSRIACTAAAPIQQRIVGVQLTELQFKSHNLGYSAVVRIATGI